MNELSRVAVIVVNWNSGGMLEKCITALDRQTRRPDRVIVVDNASSDGSPDFLDSGHDWVELLRLDENKGFAAANNMAVEAAVDCDWVALLNPDAFAEPDWLENFVKAAMANSDYSCFAGKLTTADERGTLDGTGDVYHVSGRVWRRDFGAGAENATRENDEVFSACAASAMYKRSAFVEAGGFDEDFFCYIEDVDLGFRLRILGYKCLYVKESVAAHVGSAVTARQDGFQTYHGHRNLVWTYVKNMPAALLLIHLPQHLLLNIASVVWFAARGQGRTITRAKLDAIAGLGQTLAKRRAVQKKRRAPVMKLWSAMARGPLVYYWLRGRTRRIDGG